MGPSGFERMHATFHPFDDAKARAVAWLTAWIRKAFTAPGQPVTKQVLFGSLVRRLGSASM
jgi:hypothetical protein